MRGKLKNLCSRKNFRMERKGKGRKEKESKKNVVFSKHFYERNERIMKENNVEFPFKNFPPTFGRKAEERKSSPFFPFPFFSFLFLPFSRTQIKKLHIFFFLFPSFLFLSFPFLSFPSFFREHSKSYL